MQISAEARFYKIGKTDNGGKFNRVHLKIPVSSNDFAMIKPMSLKEKSKLVRLVTSVYDDLLVNKYKDQHFWVLSAFIPIFLLARLWVHLFPETFVQVNGQHIHHFAYGFILLALAGYLAIVRTRRSPPWLAFMFGVGLALSIDEAGMWLHLTNYYYNETSENIIILTIAVLINLVYFRKFWIGLIKVMLRWLKES